MADVLNRSEKEAKLALTLQTLWTDRRRELLRLAGDPPRVENIPADYWAELERETREAIAGELLLIFLLQAETIDWGSAPTFSGQQLRARAANYAAARSSEIASNLVTRGRDFLRTSGPTAREFSERTIFVLGPTAAERIAVTETTRAASRAEIESIEEIEQTTGTRVEMIWHTERDERVCMVCGPLDRAPREWWERIFPEGPPAHPNCRCALDIQPQGIPGRLFGN